MSVKVTWKCEGCGIEAVTEPNESSGGRLGLLPAGWFHYRISSSSPKPPKKTNAPGVECPKCVADSIAALVSMLEPEYGHSIHLEPWHP